MSADVEVRMMKTSLAVAAALLLLLSSCGDEQPSQSVPANTAAPQSRPAPTPEPGNEAAQRPKDSLPETPFTPTSAQGAATVVETYYALVEAGKYAEALKLRWDADTLGLDRFKANFAPYSEYHAQVGAPSEIQGAAGSLYVEVPVQLYGRMKTGKAFGTVGTITLRRVNDVPGSTEEQKRWRIHTSD